jgi:hypothetical protein
MRKIFTLLIGLALTVSLCGCGVTAETGNQPAATSTSAEAVAVTDVETVGTVAETTAAATTTAPPEDDSGKILNTDIMGNVIDTVFEDPSINWFTLNYAVGWQPFGEYEKINTGDKIGGFRVREASSQFFIKHDRQVGDNNQLECFKNTYVLRKDVEGISRFKLKGILYQDENGEVAFRPYFNEGDEYFYILCEDDNVRDYWQERTKFDVNGKIYDVQPFDIYGFGAETADLFTEGVTYLEADVDLVEIWFSTSSQGMSAGMYGTRCTGAVMIVKDTWLLETEYTEGLDGEKIYLYEGTETDSDYYTFDFGYIMFLNETGDGYFTKRVNSGEEFSDFAVISAKTGYDRATGKIDHTEITIETKLPGKLIVDEGGLYAPGTVLFESKEFPLFTAYTPLEPANRLGAVITNYTEADITSYDKEVYHFAPLRMVYSERQSSRNYAEISDRHDYFLSAG